MRNNRKANDPIIKFMAHRAKQFMLDNIEMMNDQIIRFFKKFINKLILKYNDLFT